MNKRLTAAARFRSTLGIKRSALRSWAAGNRHCSLALAQMRRQGANPKQYRKGDEV